MKLLSCKSFFQFPISVIIIALFIILFTEHSGTIRVQNGHSIYNP